ncbi:uncharacterized protein EV420DRAFT_1316524 [Desarmillaria tabescens]|uniref:Restriction endonuclease type IV Mrr domain-containing protein n=1 Tax=Armillaria tabescens TaxID=1929756 RepID=A0AA39J958_ARMTA|nr:uncharacterized protein EV420DRAFT_1316524 [Desarmillaria tabescens]KAK0438338.1 hypothetical protein EV420DRAFT_1316524 [Desarmillaria tabescens]
MATPSTVFRGTTFENRSLAILKNVFGMALRRVGGKNDGGVDLVGWWGLPTATPGTSTNRLRVIAQCKAEKKKFSPRYVREMEGVAWRYGSIQAEESESAPPPMPLPEDDQNTGPLIALLLSESTFTKATLLRAQSSPVPFMLAQILNEEEMKDIDAPIAGITWNVALRNLMEGYELRWEVGGSAQDSEARPSLWHKGQRVIVGAEE